MPTNARDAGHAGFGEVAESAEITEIGRLLAARRDADAERRAVELVTRRPHCGAAWKALGVARLRQGRDALAVLHQASVLLPQDADVLELIAGAFQRAGHPTEALAACQRALALCPDDVRALRRLASVSIARGDHGAATDACRAVLAIVPDDAATLLDLGNLYRLDGDRAQAAACYRRAIAAAPDFADAHFNLGVVCGEDREGGGDAQAIAHYTRALASDARHLGALLNLGNALNRLARRDEAAMHLRQALAIDPTYAAAWLGLGNVHAAQGEAAAAVDAFGRAAALRPDFAEAALNLGNAQKDLGRFDEALAAYRRAIGSAPGLYVAHNNLIYTQALIPGYDPRTTHADTLAFGQQVAQRAGSGRAAWPNAPLPDRQLRVGLVSGDLRSHPVGYFIESVLAQLRARDDLTITAYANQPRGLCDDALAARIAGLCHRWRSIASVDDATVARRIHEDGIDLLVDLSGHIEHNRLPLFALRAAPVQASWLGFQGSTGIAAIDYIIADRWTVPAAQERYFTEQVWRLPATLWCLTPPAFALEPSGLPALARGRGYVTFGCFNRIEKINPAVLALWSRVLHTVDRSRLLLKTPELAFESVRRRIVEGFAAYGVGADRLIFAGATPRCEHLAAYHDVDLALDPFPYAGATTTVEALWMGVPTVTLAGQRFIERQGVSLLMNAGLPQCVADTPDDYVARVETLVGDLPALARLRGELRAQVLRSPLFDAPRMADDLAAAWRGMWQRWCSARPEADTAENPSDRPG